MKRISMKRVREFKYDMFTSFGKYIKSNVRRISSVTVVTEVWQLFVMRRILIAVICDTSHIDDNFCYIGKE